MDVGTEVAAGTLAGIAGLLEDIGAGKRIAGTVGFGGGERRSVAERFFAGCWARLIAGQDTDDAALDLLAEAACSVSLGAIDQGTMAGLGISPDARSSISAHAIADLSPRLPPGLASLLSRRALNPPPAVPLPAFVSALCAQPRAGATRPGFSRLPITPTESHGDHCALVAIGGVLLSEHFAADRGTVLLAGLAHHLHNARLPDAGYAGEIALGDQLAPLMAQLFDAEIATLPPGLGAAVREALDATRDTATPEGRAFVTADVFDRVLQVRYHAAVAAFDAAHALDDLALVHPGPLQSFQLAMLQRGGLA